MMSRPLCSSGTTNTPHPPPSGACGWVGLTVPQCFGGHGERETPGPIPNPEAKPLSADGTALETGWESRTPPDILWRWAIPRGMAFRISVRRQRWGVRVEDRRGEPRGGARAGRGGPPQGARRSDSRERDSRPRAERPVDPELPEDVTSADLDRALRDELGSLGKDHAAMVGAHLAAAIALLDDDPQAAYQHALAARRRAGRLGGVREVMGIAAYKTGKYAEALAELRAARRITGRPDFLPVIADAERGLGRSERALAVGAEQDAQRLDEEGQIELRIVLAGARRDLGQPQAAVALLGGK